VPSVALTTRLSLAALVVGAGIFACAVTPLGATDAGMAQARSRTSTGADAFERNCAACHGKRGEGLTTAPAIMGPGALPRYPRDDTSSSSPTFQTIANQQQDTTRVPGQARRGAFTNAQDVFEYISTRMPLPRSAAGTLKPEEYWAIVNFMLIAHGARVPNDGVTPANASSVSVQPEQISK